MNEQAINKVIGDYAVEVANLRIIVATLQDENEKLKVEIDELKNDEEATENDD